MRVLVIGGGIGGMAAALALLGEGVEVEVYEAAPELEEIGAGLQISSNAARSLQRLGLGDDLERVGVAAEAIDMRDLRTNELLHHTPLGEAAAQRYGAGFYQVHRPDLLGMLVAALPAGIVHQGQRCVRVTQDAEGVTAWFESGRTASGDVVIGADGIHSVVRRQLLGEQGLEFSKIIAWRSLIPASRAAHLDLPPRCHVWWGPHRSAVVYWVSGMELLNFVGIVPSEEAHAESWTAQGEVATVRRSYEGAAPQLQAIVDLVEAPFVTGYYFREPLPRWGTGRATILGDAAHPMHPFLAQGACQSIEDAVVVARCLSRHGRAGAADALREYEDRRRPRTSRVQTLARSHERMWHMSDPEEIDVRNGQLRTMMDVDPAGETIWSWIYSYDPLEHADAAADDPAAVMQRTESRRAWRLWANMIGPEDREKGTPGIRDAYDRMLLDNFPATEGTVIEEVDADGVACLLVSPPDTADGPVMVHLHGGGYLVGTAASSTGLASRLAAAIGGRCLVVDYRRAPESVCPAPVEDTLTAYRWLLHQGVAPSRVAISGESAGGGLAVAAAVALRDGGDSLPSCLIALCPFADLSLAGSSIDETAGQDPISTRQLLTQMAASYLQGQDPTTPLASPVYADLRGLPPLLIQASDVEALRDDALRLAAKAEGDGVDVEVDTYDDAVHMFPIFDFLSEAGRAVQQVGSFVQRHV
ncbi:MAG: alpha/beta hydrolase fold domain-containing protein [Pseudonocardiaceae bacterium]|nr:alpha/beta hydrolase fold domain-containing protein [Pseudonocardiaceae bacterium]